MNKSEFYDSLVSQTREALAAGAKRILFWGLNGISLSLIDHLINLGVPPDQIIGISDSTEIREARHVGSVKLIDPSDLLQLDIDTLIITSDEGKQTALRTFSQRSKCIPRVIMAGLGHLNFSNADYDAILLSCLVKSYATGYPLSLVHLFQSIQYLAAKGLKGDVAEFGICKGGTVVFIRKALDHFGLTTSKVYGFDIFDGFPTQKSVLDLYRHPKCEFKDYDTVTNYCNRFGVEVIKGDICETYHYLTNTSLILSFFDTDNYSPSRAALQTCADNTVTGGILFFDHFTTTEDYLYTIGERIAASEVLQPERFFNPHGTGLFIKL